MSTGVKIGFVLLTVNFAGFAAFLVIREPDEARLDQLDALAASGAFEFSTAAPITYLAARPLFNWSSWHGGEASWVIALELANLPALIMASVLTPPIAAMVNTTPHYGGSWIRAWLFLFSAVAQWLFIGSLISMLRTHQREGRSPTPRSS